MVQQLLEESPEHKEDLIHIKKEYQVDSGKNYQFCDQAFQVDLLSGRIDYYCIHLADNRDQGGDQFTGVF